MPTSPAYSLPSIPTIPRRKTLPTSPPKRGLGIRVVEGKRVAEQAVYNRRNDSVQRLSSSNETTALQLDENGGVREVPITGGNVMNHDQIRRLDQAGQQIKQLFGNGEQDIEWAFAGGKLVILQARPI